MKERSWGLRPCYNIIHKICTWFRFVLFIDILLLGVVTWYYNDVIMGAMASQITSLTIVYSTVYSGVDQRKHQSSASLAFVRGIHRWPVNSLHKGPITRKMFPFDDVTMEIHWPTFFMVASQACDNRMIGHPNSSEVTPKDIIKTDRYRAKSKGNKEQTVYIFWRNTVELPRFYSCSENWGRCRFIQSPVS